MKILKIGNANLTIVSGTEFPETTPQQLVGNVSINYNVSPQELDLPSGAFWLWGLKLAQLTFQYFIPPGRVDMLPIQPAAGADLVAETVSFSAKLKDAAVESSFSYSGMLTAFSVKSQGGGDNPFSPPIQVSKTYIVAVDDNGETGTY